MTVFRCRTRTALAVAGVVTLLAVSCGGESTPASSSPPTTIAAPTTPPPTPPPGGSVGAASCPIGKGSTEAYCSRGHIALLGDVESAMDILVQQKPEIFDLADRTGATTQPQYRVRDKEAYLEGVLANLRAGGLCAQRDYDLADIIQVKSINDFSEDFEIYSPDGYMVRGTRSYLYSCHPASFPVDPDPGGPPQGSGCGKPYPGPIARWAMKVHIKTPQYFTLDSTPLVGPDYEYCVAIGYTDGRRYCPVRGEGAPDRGACENWRVGTAKDTGRPGPTWTRNGAFCTGGESGCENHPGGQYLVNAVENGTYTACTENGVCGDLVFER